MAIYSRSQAKHYVFINTGYFEDNKPVFEFKIKSATQTFIENNLDYLISYDYCL